MEDSVEIGIVRGRQVALPAHFHEEDQLVLVLCGRRRLIIGSDIFSAEAGETLFIPAGVIHSSLAEEQDLLCVNAYLPVGCDALASLRQSLTMAWQAGKLGSREDVLAMLQGYRMPLDAPVTARRDLGRLRILPNASVAEAASAHGLSREHYSRQFRLLHGVPPQVYRLLQRLNLARDRLRVGGSIAEVALDTGFTDQSHLSRAFKRAFGVSPGRYLLP